MYQLTHGSFVHVSYTKRDESSQIFQKSSKSSSHFSIIGSVWVYNFPKCSDRSCHGNSVPSSGGFSDPWSGSRYYIPSPLRHPQIHPAGCLWHHTASKSLLLIFPLKLCGKNTNRFIYILSNSCIGTTVKLNKSYFIIRQHHRINP